jgi:hypothetical protein
MISIIASYADRRGEQASFRTYVSVDHRCRVRPNSIIFPHPLVDPLPQADPHSGGQPICRRWSLGTIGKPMA